MELVRSQDRLKWECGTIILINSATAPATVTGKLNPVHHWLRAGKGDDGDDPEVRRPAVPVTLPAYEGYAGAALRAVTQPCVAACGRAGRVY